MAIFGNCVFGKLKELNVVNEQIAYTYFELAAAQPVPSANNPVELHSLHSTILLHWCLFCQYLFGIYSVKVISTGKWCLE